ncbi:GntR family transcriptional regulator [Halomonas urumqiensis]|uniref:GntR family transcriptional regulator n=1 Tax=Halomonas urumqiensis TaxID=1684789 RepID=A0A2N7UM76_9GAMM|nr:GntR family transcriptional regulator [Halomonas urumqiensis]PMR81538.1 GntR family transcriptional regulator [Halomonas urumqiensis]PTB02174.1 GntR family transcriptional regulator [Halomonas urumqiensis]GHE21632.1 transcriptional regulator [Halomonas urumqiensis]
MSTSSTSERSRRVTTPSLAEEAYQALHQRIVRGQLAPGTTLLEPALCENLGISRTPLREALKRLSGEGLVILPRNRRARVAPIDAEELQHLFEVEAGLESMAASLAASRMTNTEIKQLEGLQQRLERLHAKGDRSAYFELNQRIHGLIVAGARNPVLTETHQRLLGRLERARYLALDRLGRWQESTDEHQAILDALRARDSERASQLMRDHVQHTGEAIAATTRR